MKTSALLLVVCFVLVGGWLTACSRRQEAGKAALGPMLSEKLLPDARQRQLADEMRTWVQRLKPSDAQRLNGVDKLILTWAELQAAYPEQARLIDNYEEKMRVSMVKAFQKQSKPIPARLAAHHFPDTVEVTKSASGECWVVISSRTGIQHSYLEIAAAR